LKIVSRLIVDALHISVTAEHERVVRADGSGIEARDVPKARDEAFHDPCIATTPAVQP
jgi:hypothetical protein